MNFSKKKNTSLNVIKARKIKILLQEPKNNECFECMNLYPEFISLNNAIFLCQNCVKTHLNFPKSISHIIRNNLSSLTLKNIQYLCCGGNQKLIDFINNEYPNLKKLSAEYLYQTYAMDYYRRWLYYLIEGGVKPIKPDNEKGYELINIAHNIRKTKKLRNFNKIKSESFMKIFKNRYPKIKPIVGSKNSFRFTRSLSRYNDNNLNLTTITNYNNSLDLDNIYNYSNHKSITKDFKKRFFSSQFNKKYDTDEIYSDKNNITDINELSEFNDNYNDEDYFNDNINNEDLRTKKFINEKENLETNIKVLRTSNKTPNNTNMTKTIYSKPLYQNYLNSFHHKNYLNQNKIEHNSYTRTEGKQPLIGSIDNLRNYLDINNKINNRYILDLKHNSSNNYKGKKKLNVNNINNNIIINKNLNIYCNNNSIQRIFKKKALGNSFSINDKKQKINLLNPNERNSFIMSSNLKNEKIFSINNKYRNQIKRKLIEKENENNDFIEKIKVNRQFKNKSIHNINSIITENKYLKFDNENEGVINYNQKSKIIQRISRVLKNQKEREEKMKSMEKIKVKQKENKNNDQPIKLKEINNNDNKNITPEPKEEHKINDITPKPPVENNNNNDKNDITPKPKEDNKNIKDITPKGENEIDTKSQRKKNTLSIKEFINAPSSKKKNILDLIKTNNLINQTASPNSKKLVQIHTDPKKLPKNEFNSKTSIREMYKRKNNKI